MSLPTSTRGLRIRCTDAKTKLQANHPRGPPLMRICFSSDIHGDESQYQRLDALLARSTPDLLILGGDLFPDGDQADPPASQATYVRETFAPRIERWKARSPGLEVACIVGNHDWRTTLDTLRDLHQAGTVALLTPEAPWEFGGLHFLGFSLTPPTPFWLKDFERLDRSEDACESGAGRIWDAQQAAIREVEIESYFRSVPTLSDELPQLDSPADPWVFVCHAPPWNSALDRLPNVNHPVGSRAVREFVVERRPLLGLHGHIHDSPQLTGAYFDRVEGVLCVNPGQADDRLHAVIFEADDPAGTLRHTVAP
ncbi:MAG: hypothetical protein D6744_04730 [Planctomycetota bacterium]|nr:MAG: hypothetical protein D6744_04730 [Planctomycetota bacterium]